MHDLKLSQRDIARYQCDGFIVFDRFLEDTEIELLRSRFEPLFRGQWQTGLAPDEVNWQEGRDDPRKTRQLCNTWRADYGIASVVLQAKIGEIAATLSRWPGTRIHLDNVLWKPPGADGTMMHQDGSWLDYLVPPNMCSLWMALDDTKAGAGTIEYVQGSHTWRRTPKPGRFLGEDYLHFMRQAAEEEGIVRPEIVPVEVPAGGLAIHDAWTWHGAAPNGSAARARRAVVAHCTRSDTVFHPTHTTHVYARYRRRGTDEMDESFFPVLWREDGYRTPWLNDYMAGTGRASAA